MSSPESSTAREVLGATLSLLRAHAALLFGGVGFGIVYARAAGIPVASTVDASVETFA